MANRNIERAVRFALFAAGTASAGVYSPGALAQEQEIEQVIVTGSRIPQPNIEGTSPVTMVGAQEIQFEGAQNTEELMNNLPQVFANQGGNLANGASGTSTIDLRGLGPNRTLVLVNGRRMPAGSPAGPVAPDVNAIPTPLIKRVEVLTGGASAVYGSDAVSGVVNFIMLDDFEGVQFDGTYSGYQHSNDNNKMQKLVEARGFEQAPGTVFDGQEFSLSMTMGSNFADGKGNATLFVGYTSTDALLQSERDYSACSLDQGAGAIANDLFRCGGSGTTYPVYFTDFSNYALSLDPDTGLLRDGRDPYNFGPLNYYQRPAERWQADVFAHYDFSESVQAYAEFMFMDNSSVAQIAPSGSFFTTQNISCSNPLWQQDGAQWYNALCSSPDDVVTGYVGRRNVEGGGRRDNLDLTQYRGVIGFRGTFADNWNYDVSAQYGKVLLNEWYANDFSKTRINRSLDVILDPRTDQDTYNTPVCRSVVDGTDPACVPWNIWALNGVTPEAINYLQIPLFSSGSTDQTVVTAAVSSDLGAYGVKMPTAQDAVSVAFGAEYRQEGLEFNADANYQAFEGAGQGGPILPVKGSYNVTDIFGEVRVPLVQDMFMAKELTLNGSYRYSDYSTDINTNTYGIGLDWAPIDDVKFRGSFQHAVRAPNVIELFSAPGVGLFDWTDPCSDGTLTLEQCVNTGLDPNRYLSPALSSPAGQYNVFGGGNTNLDPEKADTWTAGIVFTPTFFDGFSLTLDYWSIKVDDTISTIPPSVSVEQCGLTADPFYCDRVQRDDVGSLWINGQVVALNENIGTTETAGWDANLLYNWQMGDWGALNFNLVGTYIDKLSYEPVPKVSQYDCVGFYGPSGCGTPTPEWRSKFRTTWQTPWNVDVSLNWRYYSSVDIDLSSSDPDLAGAYISETKTLDAQNYFDLAVVYTFAEKYTLNAGINNLTDTDPPLAAQTALPFGNGNTFPQVYDAMGRYMFVGLSAKF